MKKIIAVFLVVALLFSFAGCGASKPEKVTSNDYVNIDGIYVNNSYKDKESSALKMVYLFLSINAKDKNLKIDSQYTKMKIGESNSYDSVFYKGQCTYAPNYYYSSFIEDLYVGKTNKLVLTFKVPEGDLVAGKEIVFEDTAIPVDDLRIKTDDIIACKNEKEICQKADPEGYKKESAKHKDADSATVKKVRSLLNGYYYTFYVTAGTSIQTHEIEFFAPNKFEVRTSFGTNGGKYKVKKNYIYITYSKSEHTVKIPYELKGKKITLDLDTAFSIYE
ncbi:MAG: hypothetical protein E7537_00370 [Ruminococcaceae bacterium]|nr:hypothetical protein [Oscillospiraceae bacterium]